MPTLPLLLALVPPTAVLQEEAPLSTVDYTVEVLPVERVCSLEARIDGLQPGRAELRVALPRAFAFVRLDEPLLEGPLEARGPDGEELEVERGGPWSWTVATGGRRTVRLSWVVPIRHRELAAVREARDAFEFPYLEDDHGLLVAGALFVAPAPEREPDGPQEPACEAGVRFLVPEGWDVLAPWPEDPQEPGRYLPGRALWNDLVAVGAWGTRVVPLEGLEVTVAVAPRQGELLERVGEPIARIVSHELEVFGRAPRERYLFLFGRSGIQGFGGSPKTGSMTLTVGGPAREVADEYVPHLVAHEFFHTWAAGSALLSDELRWLNEGVTDWYAYLVCARVGLSPWEELARLLGQKLDALLANPLLGERSLAEAGGPEFFEGGDAYSLVYDGGLVVGAWLDRALRARHGTSLDALLRAFLNEPAEETGGGGGSGGGGLPRLGLERFLEVVRAHADEALAARLEALLREPFAPDPAALFAEVGVEVEDTGEGFRVAAEPWRPPR